MPRIDPLQLLNCLSVLLTPSGGILSKDEVQRLASLMTKFSKKSVSKCVYVLILKNTEKTLLGAFMGAGGWTLIQVWLQDAMCTNNWALVKELLELLIITPVDVERLKSNNIPKLVKSLSKKEDQQGIHQLSNKLVQQWLKIVKDETQSELVNQQQLQATTSGPIQIVEPIQVVHHMVETPLQLLELPTTEQKPQLESAGQTFYKITVRDGKQVFSKVDPSEANYTVVENAVIEEISEEDLKKEDKKERINREKHRSGSSKSSSSSSTSSKDRRDRHKSSSNKDKSRDRDRKDKHRNNGSIKHSSQSKHSSKSKERKEAKDKQAEKDKETLAKMAPQGLQKLGRIPKKSAEDKGDKEVKKDEVKEVKKPTMSIEVRKINEDRPKTVKVYNAKMRSTGLEEEAKPPPPRTIKKPTTPVPVVPPPKRTSPIRDIVVPPEKKSRLEDKVGAIKLIPPKPKPPILQESDMFMDALAASATKKEPKKRKRRASVSKDSAGSPPSSPTAAAPAVSPVSSPTVLKNIAPPKFYQDTLDTEEVKPEISEGEEGPEIKKEKLEEPERSVTPVDNNAESSVAEDARTTDNNGLKSVLVYTKRKGPKKSISWKRDEDLVEVQYFELDETERVNVTKTFLDMAKMEMCGERQALQMSRKLPNEDVMDVQTNWRFPAPIEAPDHLAEPGCKSLEKDIQFAREKNVLQSLYFNKSMVPDSPAEPDLENYQIIDPVLIPIDDPENPEHDFRNTPWPEPKGSPPQSTLPNVPQIFPNLQNSFQNFPLGPPPSFQGVQPFGAPANPGFMPPIPGDWNAMNNGPMMPGPPPEMMHQGPPMNPNSFGHENFNPMMNENNNGFQPGFNQPGPGMFPPNNFNRGRGGFRRGGGTGPWIRMNGPAPGGWNNQGRGGGNRGGRFCHSYRKNGFCRNRDSCPYMHN